MNDPIVAMAGRSIQEILIPETILREISCIQHLPIDPLCEFVIVQRNKMDTLKVQLAAVQQQAAKLLNMVDVVLFEDMEKRVEAAERRVIDAEARVKRLAELMPQSKLEKVIEIGEASNWVQFTFTLNEAREVRDLLTPGHNNSK